MPDAGIDLGQVEKAVAEDEMADGVIDAMDMNLSKPWEMLSDRKVCCTAVHGKSWKWMGDWTAMTMM